MLFDLDGTLTDPKEGITTCVQYALHSMGIEEPDLDKLIPFIGPPLKDSFMQFYGMDEEQALQAIEKYRERFQDTGIFENEVYKGIPKMLEELQKKGVQLAVASSKPTVYVERILEHFQIRQYFRVVVGSELDGRRVNKDEIIHEALNKLFYYKPIQKELVYMIGDRKFDVEGAREHRIECVAVTYGYGSIEELKEAKADYIVRSVEELKKFLLREAEELEEEGNSSKKTVRQGSSYGKPKNPFSTKKILQIAFPFFTFLAVKLIASNVLSMMGTNLPDLLKAKIMVQDEAGNFTGFTGDAVIVISAIASLVAVWSIRKKATLFVTKTGEDMRLSHLKKEPVSRWIVLIVTTVGAVLGLNLLFNIAGFVNNSEAYQDVVAVQYGGSFWIGLICYGFISAFAEEVAFRGILYTGIRRLVNGKFALIVSAVIFGVYHGNEVQSFYAFIMGCLIAYAYEYFGTFWVPVLIHVLANVLAYSFTYVVGAVPGLMSMPLCIVSLAAALIGVGLLHWKKKIY